jgi:hypothetical protein
MIPRLRDTLFRAMVSPRGDSVPGVRLTKALARQVNDALGAPIASEQELTERAAARAQLRDLRAGARSPAAASRAAPAPVFVYFEEGRNVRELMRIEELLAAKGIAWNRLDARDDEAMIEFIVQKVGCEVDDLPVVFVADRPVGPYPALVRADVSGELATLLRG